MPTSNVKRHHAPGTGLKLIHARFDLLALVLLDCEMSMWQIAIDTNKREENNRVSRSNKVSDAETCKSRQGNTGMHHHKWRTGEMSGRQLNDMPSYPLNTPVTHIHIICTRCDTDTYHPPPRPTQRQPRLGRPCPERAQRAWHYAAPLGAVSC